MTAAAPIRPARTALPDAHIRGRRVARLTGQSLGWERLDAATAERLSGDSVAWLVGGHGGLDALVGQIIRLGRTPAGGRWVVVPHSNEAAGLLALRVAKRWGMPLPDDWQCWRYRRACVITPERLRKASDCVGGERLAGVIVYDGPCVMHLGRTVKRRVPANDRPQRVVNFRAAHATGDYLPPILILTCRPLAAIDPEPIRRAYCLDQFQYIAGSSFACWEIPVPMDEPDGLA